jgi:gas vesicle protein GvpG
MFLLDDLLLLPVDGFTFILKQIQQVADREFNDESVIKSQLLELQMRLELDEISEDEYKESEASLFARLRTIKQQQLDMIHEAIHTSKNSSLVIDSALDES